MKPSGGLEKESRDHRAVAAEIVILCNTDMDPTQRRREVARRCKELGQMFIPPDEKPETVEMLRIAAKAPGTYWDCTVVVTNLLVHLNQGGPRVPEGTTLAAGQIGSDGF